MRRTGLFRKLKTLSQIAAVFALFSFGFQSSALPAHTTIHATQKSVKTAVSVASFVESDCELCDLSSHQAITISAIPHFDVVEGIAIRSEAPRTEIFARRLALLPPARGPPARA